MVYGGFANDNLNPNEKRDDKTSYDNDNNILCFTKLHI